MITATIVQLIANATAAGKALLLAADAAAQKALLNLTKSDVGLSNVDNTSDADKPVSTATAAALSGKANSSHGHAQSDVTGLVSALAAKADLVGGLVPSSQLPSYVDDVIEGANLAAFPATGEAGKIYVALDTGRTYRWSGSTYAELTDSTAVWGSISGTLINQTDLQTALNGRALTSHTHTSAAITDFAEAVDDEVASLLVQGSGISLSYNDAANTLTIASTATGTIGGSTGATDNAILLASGTDGSTVKASGATIDASGNFRTAGGTIQAGNINGVRLVPQGGVELGISETILWSGTVSSGGGKDTGIRRNAAGVVEINNGTAGTSGTLAVNNIRMLSGSNVTMSVGAAGSTSAVILAQNTFNYIRLMPGSGIQVASGLFVGWSSAGWNPTGLDTDTALSRRSAGAIEVNNGVAGTLRDFFARDMTASGAICFGPITFATLPSASANTGKVYRLTDRSGRLAYSDGTNWRWFADDTIVS